MFGESVYYYLPPVYNQKKKIYIYKETIVMYIKHVYNIPVQVS